MTPEYQSHDQTVYLGDALAVLKTLPDESVQCCVTSPPFFGLRDYRTATWDGGDVKCDHCRPGERRQIPHGDGRANDSYRETRTLIPGAGAMYKDICGKCGAKRIDQQIGLEASPAEYVATMVVLFREVRRVLRKDGTCWIEIGDSYAGAGYSNHANTGGAQREDGGKQRHTSGTNIPSKNLMMMPARVVIALQEDGWIIRAENVWSRPNPMPESVRDRTTRAHSMVYMLAKSERYFYDAEAIAESAVTLDQSNPSYRANGKSAARSKDVNGAPGQKPHQGLINAKKAEELYHPLGRNKRSVWTIPIAPFPGAHFATFPPALVRPCILAGTSPGDTVLDPFLGSGTTLVVGQALGRRGVGIELNPTYVAMAAKRLQERENLIAIPPAPSTPQAPTGPVEDWWTA